MSNVANFTLLTLLYRHEYVANHVDALKEQLLRVPKQFPKLFVNPAITAIDNLTYDFSYC